MLRWRKWSGNRLLRYRNWITRIKGWRKLWNIPGWIRFWLKIRNLWMRLFEWKAILMRKEILRVECILSMLERLRLWEGNWIMRGIVKKGMDLSSRRPWRRLGSWRKKSVRWRLKSRRQKNDWPERTEVSKARLARLSRNCMSRQRSRQKYVTGRSAYLLIGRKTS